MGEGTGGRAGAGTAAAEFDGSNAAAAVWEAVNHGGTVKRTARTARTPAQRQADWRDRQKAALAERQEQEERQRIEEIRQRRVQDFPGTSAERLAKFFAKQRTLDLAVRAALARCDQEQEEMLSSADEAGKRKAFLSSIWHNDWVVERDIILKCNQR